MHQRVDQQLNKRFLRDFQHAQAIEALVALNMVQIAPNEAAHGIWEFISCILMPDIVRFRFPGRDRTILERFLGGPRNTFGRLWWRAFIFRDDTESDNLTLLKQLKEDEIGQIMERRAICGNRRLVNRICRGFLESNRKYSISNRMELMRDAQKRILRLSSFISFDAIDDGQLARIIEKVFESSVAALK